MDGRRESTQIAGVPALIFGEPSEQAYLFVHGKMGCKEEAEPFAALACPAGYQVVSIDLPEHGSRKNAPEQLLPWVAVPEIRAVHRAMQNRWRLIHLRATSIGAWLSLLALQNQIIGQALLVSPVVDMEQLIEAMMGWVGVTEDELREKQEISTAFGETLSWEYLCWVRRHPLVWRHPTRVLYAGGDHLTPRFVMDRFAAETGSRLTVMENGEHWFHTEEQLHVLRQWEKQYL